ncbi:MAG TPA: hypothetical protein VI757_01820 [Bacteroidia bacterium]|nr:hypothetical protein [Bacteroidia bacterium]
MKLQKHFLFTCFVAVLLLHPCFVSAQFKPMKIIAGTDSVGMWYAGNKIISANTIHFPFHVYDFRIDTAKREMFCLINKKGKKKFRDEGYAAMIKLDSLKVSWSLPVYDFHLVSESDIILLSNNAERITARLNWSDGKVMWRDDFLFWHIIPKLNIGLNNMVRAYDLETGKRKWERTIGYDFGWNGYTIMHDSILIIASSGLHGINLHNGKGWDYKMKTGEADYSVAVAATAAGLALALFTGFGFVSTSHSVLHNVCSDLLEDSGRIYFSGMEQIVCRDSGGKKLWADTLTDYNSSKSHLFLNDSLLLLVNTGYAYKNNRKTERGRPYILCWNKYSGERKYLLSLYEKKTLELIVQRKDELVLFAGSTWIKISIPEGKIVSETKVVSDSCGEIDYLVNAPMFFTGVNDSLIENVRGTDNTSVVYYNKEKQVVVGDSILSRCTKINDSLLYRFACHWNGMRFLQRNNKVFFTNKDGLLLGELNAESVLPCGDMLIGIKEKDIFIVTSEMLN